MSSASLHIRISPDLKQQFEATIGKIGLSTPEALRLFMRRVVAEQALPFEFGRVPNAVTIQALEDSMAGRNMSKRYDSVDAMMADLLSDDDEDDLALVNNATG